MIINPELMFLPLPTSLSLTSVTREGKSDQVISLSTSSFVCLTSDARFALLARRRRERWLEFGGREGGGGGGGTNSGG